MYLHQTIETHYDYFAAKHRTYDYRTKQHVSTARPYAEWLVEAEKSQAELREYEAASVADGLAVYDAECAAEFLLEAGAPLKDVRMLRVPYEQTPALEAVAGAGQLRVLASGPGAGKTFAATAWLAQQIRGEAEAAFAETVSRCWGFEWWSRENMAFGGCVTDPKSISSVLKRSRNQRRTTAPLFVRAVALARWNKYDADEMKQLLDASALVIDDLGVEYSDQKGAFASLLDEVIDHRYGNQAPTLITTNLTAKEFKERYGERIADRLREAGGFVAVSRDSFRPTAKERYAAVAASTGSEPSSPRQSHSAAVLERVRTRTAQTPIYQQPVPPAPPAAATDYRDPFEDDADEAATA